MIRDEEQAKYTVQIKNADGKPELLAPAGDLEKLKYALAYGADAVYLGGTAFGLRAYAGNFTYEDMQEGVRLVREAGKKVYVAVNIYAHEEDIEQMPEYLQQIAELGVDAAIVSDPGVIAIAQEVAPNLHLHLSTQANSTNSQSIKFWMKHGVERVVLARELPLEELQTVRAKIDGELEMFIHGAMCMSYSGRCLLSNYLVGRDANRGECTQPCRWEYGLVEEKRPGEVFPIEEDERGTYIFNSHDLCLLPDLPILKTLNIESWKIEGRMKSAHYVASTVKVYREAIDTLWDEGEEAFQAKLPGWLEEMDKVSHRDYSSGFMYGKPGASGHNFETSHYVREYEFVGLSVNDLTSLPAEAQALARAESVDGAGVAAGPDTGVGAASGVYSWVEQRNNFKQGEIIEVLAPVGEPWKFEVKRMWDVEGNELDVARHPLQIIRLEVPRAIPQYSLLRRAKTDKKQ